MKGIFFVLILFVTMSASYEDNEPSKEAQQKILMKVNRVRSMGCKCGRRNMPPVNPVTWNSKLYQSALIQAQDMDEHKYFGHFSHDGLDIGARLDRVDYPWIFAGENLGEGQKSLDEVIEDWIKSYEHCIMLMNPKVKEMGLAHYNKYWVQHFGAQLPPGSHFKK